MIRTCILYVFPSCEVWNSRASLLVTITMTRATLIAILFLETLACSPTLARQSPTVDDPGGTSMTETINLTEDEWKERLTPEQYRITRQCGTEPPFSGALYYLKDEGIYHCIACGAPLFTSDDKYESGSGWPSYMRPIRPDAVTSRVDRSHGMVRTEVRCARCGAHLGHVFEDGPEPTGLRYCINSVALSFSPAEQEKSSLQNQSADSLKEDK